MCKNTAVIEVNVGLTQPGKAELLFAFKKWSRSRLEVRAWLSIKREPINKVIYLY